MKLGDVLTGALQHRRERRRRRCGLQRDENGGTSRRGRESHGFTTGASFSSTDTLNWRKFEYVAVPVTR